ncbi:MAG TPA: SEC-C metal-binding domain-containing protein [Blastocatellia bacterium]|nr:SEC-C metal-binding domain-containing protein [Blastocatellia bacterium]
MGILAGPLDNRRLSCRTEIEVSVRFRPIRKRRLGFPAEKSVKRGGRRVHGDKELSEKLGRKDLCPCGSGRRFQALLSENRKVRRLAS